MSYSNTQVRPPELLNLPLPTLNMHWLDRAQAIGESIVHMWNFINWLIHHSRKYFNIVTIK